MNDNQHALAAVIRAEMAAQRVTATEMQRRTGIKHASWRNYFVTAIRPVPYPDVVKVCEVLGVPTSEMLRRAEARSASAPAATLAEHVTNQLSPDAQAAVRAQRARLAEGTNEGHPNG